MITVSIYINGNPIITRSAVRKTFYPETAPNEYYVDDGHIILHIPRNGACALATKMLKGVQESSLNPRKAVK